MSLVHIPSEIRDEFTIDRHGNAGVTAAGIARLCDVSKSALSQLFDRIRVKQVSAESLKSLMGKDFKAVKHLSDVEASKIIEYYAMDAGRYCKPQAKAVYRAFSAIGLRSWVQSELGWKPQKREPQDDLRLSSTEVRKATMDALHAAGFTESRHYINVTTAAYMGLFGMSAKSLRKDRGLPDGCNVRDHLTEEELAALRLIEINLKETLRVIEFTRSSDVNRHIKAVAASIRSSLAAGAVRGQLPG
jgi:hypothetical protein